MILVNLCNILSKKSEIFKRESIVGLTVLITGIAGFIGSALAESFMKEGVHVVGVDNLSTGVFSNIPMGAFFIEGNVQNSSVISALSEYKFDAIFHIAGQSSGEISFVDPVYDLQTNCQSTLMLLDMARNTGCKRFVYASTMSVYGNPLNSDLPVKEDHILQPLSFYAVGKIASENYLEIYSKFYKISCVSLRLFNVYGPGQNLSNLKQGMVSIYLAQALLENRIIVKGSDQRFRDQIYIDDVVTAFLAAWKNIQPGFSIYNIATGRKTAVFEIIDMLRKYIDGIDSVEYVQGTPGDQFGIVGDIGKAQTELGWSPTITFQCGLKKMIEWAKQTRS